MLSGLGGRRLSVEGDAGKGEALEYRPILGAASDRISYVPATDADLAGLLPPAFQRISELGVHVGARDQHLSQGNRQPLIGRSLLQS